MKKNGVRKMGSELFLKNKSTLILSSLESTPKDTFFKNSR
jgi:hypothetical protein